KRHPGRIPLLHRRPLDRRAFFLEMFGEDMEQPFSNPHIAVVPGHIKYKDFIIPAADHPAADDTGNDIISYSHKTVLTLSDILFDFLRSIPKSDIFNLICLRQPVIDSIQPTVTADFSHSF